jgi:hypothetical protein
MAKNRLKDQVTRPSLFATQPPTAQPYIIAGWLSRKIDCHRDDILAFSFPDPARFASQQILESAQASFPGA